MPALAIFALLVSLGFYLTPNALVKKKVPNSRIRIPLILANAAVLVMSIYAVIGLLE